MEHWKVLLVTKDRGAVIADTLLDWGIKMVRCSTVSQARQILSRQAISQIFCDAHLPDGNFRDVVEIARMASQEPPIVVLIPQNSGESTFLEAIEAGAFDSISSPVSRPEVQWEIVQAMRKASHTQAA
ncbi:MAG TPA: hypothetical protein VFJ47_00420 [Terriglobales bacterium]|nr:hypothetical protein [Terriglobales bacterium]